MLENSLKEWYLEAHASDEMGSDLNDITFKELYVAMYRGRDFYDIIGVGDSLIRERVFLKLADCLGLEYDDIYNLWLNNI